MASLQALLAPQTLTRVVSQVASTSDWLLNLFGVNPGGPNNVYMGHGREGSFHIYDHVRKAAMGRAPGMPAHRRAANPMGKVAFTYPRMHDSVSLLAEVMHNLGRITDPAMRDVAGANMITLQTNTLGEIAANWRKMMLVGALHDTLYVGNVGDDEYFTFTAGTNRRINFQMPAGNTLKLNMLGGGDIIAASWATASTDIPGDLGQINAAFQQLCGGHLSAVIVNTTVWNEVITNTAVAAVHGSAHPPFLQFARADLDARLGNTMKNVFRAELSVLPGVIWYITDEGFDLGVPGAETYTKIVDDTHAIFLGFDPGDDVFVCYEGSEPIAEYDAGPEVVKVGLNAWSVKRANPTTTELFVLDNALMVNHIPKSVAYATVIY